MPPVTLADHAARARARLDASHWAYLDGDAADGHTRRANRAAWDALALWPRVLRPLADAGTAQTLLGQRLPWPLLVAPMAFQQLAHPDGERASALAAAAQDAGFVVSTQSSVAVETIAACIQPGSDAATPPQGPLWFQLYPQPDAGLTRALVDRAEAAGCSALLVTVDAPVQGVRDAERRHGFRLPPGIRAVHLPDGVATGHDPAAFCAGVTRHAPTWATVEAIAAHTRLPVLLKGVLHPDDAREAQRLGLAGAVVSNHGGRTLDTAVATAWALPRVADAVGGDWPLLVDGGIRRGTDILKALALGARAVLLGRPVLHGLASGGAPGVAHVLRLLRDEFEAAMALTGCARLTDIGRSRLAPQPHPEATP